MKWKVLLGLFLFLFPTFIEAKVCTVVTGTGTNLGDEIACGSEHFYIIEKNNNTYKMIAKYNLYVGDKIEKDSEVFSVATYGSKDDAEYAAYEHCTELEDTYGVGNVNTTAKYTEDGNPTEYFCRIYTPLVYDKVKQSELAIGLYPNGNMEVVYPIYGSVYLDSDIGENEFDNNLDMIPETSQFSSYLTQYKNTLTEIGVNVDYIGFIKRSGIENFVNSVSDKKLTIPSVDPNSEVEDPIDSSWFHDYDMFVYKYNIKEFVPTKYKWLYGTTYWTGSASLYKDDWATEYFDEFLSTIGDYCSYSRGCHITKMGVGLRPVITIDKSEIVIPDTYDYKFIKGDNQKLIIDKFNGYTFTINGDYSLFSSLKIGNLDLIRNQDYEVTEGSTVITFTPNGIKKLNTLPKGKYDIIVKYSNNIEVKGKLTLDEAIPNIETPKTGDNIYLYLFIGILSLIGIIITNTYLKRRLS